MPVPFITEQPAVSEKSVYLRYILRPPSKNGTECEVRIAVGRIFACVAVVEPAEFIALPGFQNSVHKVAVRFRALRINRRVRFTLANEFVVDLLNCVRIIFDFARGRKQIARHTDKARGIVHFQTFGVVTL